MQMRSATWDSSGRSKNTAAVDGEVCVFFFLGITVFDMFSRDVLSTPDHSPNKKQKRETACAVPGSPEFDALPPVSITAKGLNRDKLFGKLSFGSVDGSKYVA
jgi:hypothetical protein